MFVFLFPKYCLFCLLVLGGLFDFLGVYGWVWVLTGLVCCGLLCVVVYYGIASCSVLA